MSTNPLFEASYNRLFGTGVGIDATADPFFESFYTAFLTDRDIAEEFRNTNMARQVSMLRRSFFNLAAFYASGRPSAELERIAHVHERLGIADEHYERWLDALIETVRAHDPDCDLPTELAWRWAMTPGLTYMRLVPLLSSEADG